MMTIDTRSDYRELLNSGYVVRAVDDAEFQEAWRYAMRALAREDRLRLRTGVADSRRHVYALLIDWQAADEDPSVRRPAA